MTAEILCVGTELLIGDIVNTNAAYISKVLSYHGIDVLHHTVCGDNAKRLEECFKTALERNDIVVTTGGLGPTYDDITKKVCAETLNLELVTDENIVKALKDYFERSGRVMTENNLLQALVPEGAKVFLNNHGTAPGLCIEKNGKTVVMMPGPPREMKPMLDEQIMPYLSKYTDHVLYSSNINIFGMGESSVDQKLHEMMQSFTNPTVAPYIDDGEVRLRVTASAENPEMAHELVNDVVKKISDTLGNCVYGVDSGGLQYTLVEKLREKKLSAACAESCTGGLLSSMITDVPGSSEVFGYGVCTYANEAKIKLLGVKPETLEKYGAVSEQTACEMADGVRKLSGADIALSLTGLAGPGGAVPGKPVGLVWLGVSTAKKTYAKKLLLAQHNKPDRAFIRKLAAKNALKTALDEASEM